MNSLPLPQPGKTTLKKPSLIRVNLSNVLLGSISSDEQAANKLLIREQATKVTHFRNSSCRYKNDMVIARKFLAKKKNKKMMILMMVSNNTLERNNRDLAIEQKEL